MRNVLRLVVLLALVPTFAAAGQVFKVGPGGTHATVQEAVTASVAAGGDNEVRVAAGKFVGQVAVYASMTSGSISISGGWDPEFFMQTEEPGLTVLDAAGAGRTVYLMPAGGTITLRNLTITGGHSTDGAGIRAWGPEGASFNILDCRVVGNTAANETTPVSGAGIYVSMDSTGVAHIARTLITGNTGSTSTQFALGGVVRLGAKASAQLFLEDCLITGNSVNTPAGRSDGFGLYADADDEASVTILRTVVARNSAVASASHGAVGTYLGASDKGRLTCSRSAVVGNLGVGKANLTSSLWSTVHGEASVVFSDLVVADGSGRGLDVSVDPTAKLTVANCTVVGNAGVGIVGKATSVYNTVVFGNGSDAAIPSDVTAGGNLVGIDPLFVNAELHDYRLLPGSPAIDTGVQPPGGLSEEDFSGHPRKVGGAVDAGAHEYQGEAVLRAAALAHTTGYGGTLWRSDLDLVNLSSKPADLAVVFENANGRTTRPVTLAAGETKAWTDALTSLFGVVATAKVTGSLRIQDPTGAVVAALRTYADGGAAGTYGQGYPVLGEDAGIVAGSVGILPMVKSNAKFYSNIGVLALGQARAQVRVTLIGPSGATLGTPQTIGADPGRWVQIDDVFTKAGVPSADVAYARVEPLTQGARVWAAASVIDRTTKDPTTVEATGAVPPTIVQRVAAVTHGSGYGGTAWRSTVAIVNTGDAPATVTLTFRGQNVVSRNVPVPAHGTVEWADVIVDLFDPSGASAMSGALEVVADQPVVVACRTYADKGKDGTLGQSYPALVASQGIAKGEEGVLPQLRKSAKAYTNLGALNLSTTACSATVQLANALGQASGTPQTISTAAGDWAQISDVFRAAGASAADEAYARIQVTTEGCRMWFYASVIDSITRDPTTVELARPFVVGPGR